jgi:hypothetical protein
VSKESCLLWQQSSFKLQSHLHPGRARWSGYDREQPGYIRNSASNILDNPGTFGIRPRME